MTSFARKSPRPGTTSTVDRSPGDIPAPATESALRMTWEALRHGLDGRGRCLDRFRGRGFARARIGTRRFVFISEPEHLDHVLHARRLNYVKSLEYEPIRGTAGLNLLTDEGDSWASHRAALNPAFARRRLNTLVDLMTEPIQETLDDLLGRHGRVELDIHELMVQLTLQVVANALFGQRFGAIVDRMHDIATKGLKTTSFLERFTLVGLVTPRVTSLLLRMAFAPIPLPPPFAILQEVNRGLDDAVNDIIDTRLAHPTDSPDLLNRLIEADGGTWPRQRIRDEALTFMLAGHETTANAMAWFWYLLALHPDARSRMLSEVDEVLGGRTPTVDDLDALSWTTACVQESQRYFSAAPLVVRTALGDDTIGGHHVSAGTSVVLWIHWVHHDPRFWEDPEEFDPERFMPGAPHPARGTYLPFGGGRRVCIGQSFALMEMVLVAASLSRYLRFDLLPGHPVEPEQSITLRPRHGIRVVAHRRNDALAQPRASA